MREIVRQRRQAKREAEEKRSGSSTTVQKSSKAPPQKPAAVAKAKLAQEPVWVKVYLSMGETDPVPRCLQLDATTVTSIVDLKARIRAEFKLPLVLNEDIHAQPVRTPSITSPNTIQPAAADKNAPATPSVTHPRDTILDIAVRYRNPIEPGQFIQVGADCDWDALSRQMNVFSCVAFKRPAVRPPQGWPPQQQQQQQQ
jgi:hypothetical protein